MCLVTSFSSKIVPFLDIVEKYCIAGQATDDKMVHTHGMLAAGYLRYKYTHSGCVIIIAFHCNSGCTNVPQRYDIRILSALFNPLNAELNPICYLMALLVHHFLHVSRIRAKSLTLRLLMSYIYIYIYIYMDHLFLMFLDHTQRREHSR